MLSQNATYEEYGSALVPLYPGLKPELVPNPGLRQFSNFMVDSQHSNVPNIMPALEANLLLLAKAFSVVTHEEGLTLNLKEFISFPHF